MGWPVQSEEALAAKFASVLPHLDERQRRLLMGAEARLLGHGGIKVVAQAAGVSTVTVSKGVAELESGEPLGRTRRAGGGRKAQTVLDPGLRDALLGLVEPTRRGDPESPLWWTTKSTRTLAAELTRAGHRVGVDGGQPAARGGVQPAGQRQAGRGCPPPGPGRPVRLPQRPGRRAPGRGAR